METMKIGVTKYSNCAENTYIWWRQRQETYSRWRNLLNHYIYVAGSSFLIIFILLHLSMFRLQSLCAVVSHVWVWVWVWLGLCPVCSSQSYLSMDWFVCESVVVWVWLGLCVIQSSFEYGLVCLWYCRLRRRSCFWESNSICSEELFSGIQFNILGGGVFGHLIHSTYYQFCFIVSLIVNYLVQK